MEISGSDKRESIWSPHQGGSESRHFVGRNIRVNKAFKVPMRKELSIFVDESGDFGPYEYHSPNYIIGFVFHDQSKTVTEACSSLNESLKRMGLSKSHNIHTGPLIRREYDYQNMPTRERQDILNRLMIFSRYVDFSWQTICVDKKHVGSASKLALKLRKQIEGFIRENLAFFLEFDVVKIYYDNGQAEVTKILERTFGKMLNEVEWRKATAMKYKLKQLADLACTVQLLELKLERGCLSKSEMMFFKTTRNLRKNYLGPMMKKRMW